MATKKSDFSRWVQTGEGITNVRTAPGLKRAQQKPKGKGAKGKGGR